MTDAFASLMAAGESSKQLLVPLCKGIWEAAGKGTAVEEVGGIEHLRVVSDAINSMSKVCLAVCRIFNETISAGTTMADVTCFVDYSGPLLLERSMRSVFRQEGSFWRKQVDELIEKGATSAMLKPKLEEMHLHLSKVIGVDEQLTNESIDIMIKMTELFKELRGGIRKVELENISDKFMKYIQQLVAMCLDQKDATALVSEEAVNILAIALDYFSHVPGVLSQLKEFKTWITKNKGVLCANTLLQFIDGCTSSTQLDFQKVKTLVGQISKGCEGDVLPRLPILVRYMLNDCLTQAWFVKKIEFGNTSETFIVQILFSLM